MFSGTAAFGGKALGVAALWDRKDARIAERKAGSARQERALLDASIQRAKYQLKCSVRAQDKDAEDIIGLQIALLADDEFLDPIFSKIKSGVMADIAWEMHLDQEIDNYARSEDPHFQAIALDLVDLKKRMLGLLRENPDATYEPTHHSRLILLADDITPSEFLSIDRLALAGLALVKGSLTSHVAVLARGRGIPMVIDCPPSILLITNGSPILLDADSNILVVNPHGDRQHGDRQIAMPGLAENVLVSANSTHDLGAENLVSSNELVRIYLNIDDPEAIKKIDISSVDGIGLFRTEFMFSNDNIPSEDQQYEIYRSVLEWSREKPVIIRTFDFGGDKALQGFTLDQQMNPFLGVRGYRLSRMHPDMFRSQLKALARAAPYGNLGVMIPMVTVPLEMDEFKSVFQDVVTELNNNNINCALPKLGMMVEVPAAALTLDRFDADFYSIGSNDLIQYIMATSRGTMQPGYLADAWEHSIYRLVRECVSVAFSRNLPISICGEIASLPEHIPNLLDCGIRSLSVSPSQLGVVNNAVRQWSNHVTEKSDAFL